MPTRQKLERQLVPEQGGLGDRLRRAEVVTVGEVRLRSGEIASFYADIKKAYGDPELLCEMAEAMTEQLDPQTTCIAASGYGGIPLAVMVSHRAELPLVLVRDTPKDHGRGGLIDGYVPGPGDIVSIVDDVFTSGSSIRQTVGNLVETGTGIAGCHVVVARGDISKFDLPVSALLMPEDIV